MIYYLKIVVLRKNSNMQRLTPQEEEVMLVLWKLDKAFIKQIIDQMKIVQPYTTVASTVKNLEKKGFVEGQKFANAYRFMPKISEPEYKQAIMKEVVTDYFDNSYKAVVNFFINEKNLTKEELQELISLIEQQK